MVSWWGIDSYFNNEPNQISEVELVNDAYGSSGSFLAIVRSKPIGRNTYTGRINSFHSKPTQILVPVHKHDLNYSYSINHFSWLPQEVT